MMVRAVAKQRNVLTKPHAAVLQQVAEVIEHGFLVLTADPAEVAQEATAAGHHLGEGNFLWNGTYIPGRVNHRPWLVFKNKINLIKLQITNYKCNLS